MKKRFIFVVLSILLLSILFTSCVFTIGELVSIKFKDDKTLEYVFSISGFYGNDDSDLDINVRNCTFNPNDGYKIKYKSSERFFYYTGYLHFNKDIADGTEITLDFYDTDDNYICTHSFVKGEE